MERLGKTIEGSVRERVIVGFCATDPLSALGFTLAPLLSNQIPISSSSPDYFTIFYCHFLFRFGILV